MKSVLYIAARQEGLRSGFWSPVGRLEHLDDLYRFVYTNGAKTLEGFKPFSGMENLESVYESDELFPLFANRLPSPSRPEYEAYLAWGGFDPSAELDPLDLLGVTRGLRQTDMLEVFPCPVRDESGKYLSKFFLHGVRWMHPAAHEKIAQLKEGDELRLLFEVDNPADEYAVQLQTTDIQERLPLGYVPRYLARDVRTLCDECGAGVTKVRVEKVNMGAPMQQRVLCSMSSCWPEGFSPCSDDVFQSIGSDALTHPTHQHLGDDCE